MLYNTGDPRDVSNPNPILRLRDVKPFVSGIAAYPLPLSAAYPDYHWQRLVGGGRYKGLLYAERLDDSTVYRRVRPDAYVVISSRYVSPVVGGDRSSDVLLVPGDSVFATTATSTRFALSAPNFRAAVPICTDKSSFIPSTPKT